MTAAQMAPFVDIENPALRYIVIHDRNTPPNQKIQTNTSHIYVEEKQSIQTNFDILADP